MWPELIQAAKEGGLNTIESYVFWSGHELSPGKVRGFFFGYIFINFIDIFFLFMWEFISSTRSREDMIWSSL